MPQYHCSNCGDQFTTITKPTGFFKDLCLECIGQFYRDFDEHQRELAWKKKLEAKEEKEDAEARN